VCAGVRRPNDALADGDPSRCANLQLSETSRLESVDAELNLAAVGGTSCQMVVKRCCRTISGGGEAATLEIPPYHDRQIVLGRADQVRRCPSQANRKACPGDGIRTAIRNV
jgi:hypothetical protein